MATADADIGRLHSEPMLRGWKDIANYLEISVLRAQERAKRLRDPLPIGTDHRGPFAYVTALRDWVGRSRLAYQAHLQLRKLDPSNDAQPSGACENASIQRRKSAAT